MQASSQGGFPGWLTHGVEELPRVRDDDQRFGPLEEVVLQPQHGVEVEVVLGREGRGEGDEGGRQEKEEE